MAAVINDRDVLLQAASTRLVAVDLPPNVNLPASGTLNNVPVQTVIDGAASTGGTENYFTTSTSDPTGGADGDAHYNSTTNVMWFKIDGSWTRGGTVNANEITVGTLAAARIAVNSITSDKISVGSLSAISNDAGAITGGTFNGTAIPDLINANVTLNADGTLSGGSGAITALDYANISGTKPDANATQNFFTTSTSNPAGGATGDAHWNSATSVMWFRTPAGWNRGGTINAGEITVGTLAAARIAANSITTDKLAANSVTANEMNVGNLSAITANLGTVNAGDITGSMDIDITGKGVFRGQLLSAGQVASVVANPDKASGGFGVWAGCSTAGFSAVLGNSTGSSANGVSGVAADNGTALRGSYSGSGTGYGLNVTGRSRIGGDLTVTGTLNATVSNATNANFATTAGTANSVSASNITGSIDATTLGGSSKGSFCRFLSCNGGNTSTPVSSTLGVHITGDLFNTVTALVDGNRVEIQNKPSDAVTKNNIEGQPLGYDFINAIRPIIFERLDEPGIAINGFTANQVAAVIGRDNPITSWRKNGCMSLDQIALISPMVKAFQDMSKRLEAAESKITALQAEVNLLKGI